MINPAVADKCVKCGAELPEDRIKCPHCGEMNIASATECSECGTSLAGVEGAAPAPAAPGAPAPRRAGRAEGPWRPRRAQAAGGIGAFEKPPAMSPSVSLHVARELWNVRFVHLLAIEGVFQFATTC